MKKTPDLALAKHHKKKGSKGHYYGVMRDIARDALAAANSSNNGRRRAAAMRSLNYYGRKYYEYYGGAG